MVLAYNPSRKTRVIWIMLSKGTFILIFFHAFHNVVKTFTKSHLIIYQAWQLVKTQDNFSCNSKSMGIHLAHNIRIRLPQMKKKMRLDLAPFNLLFFNVFLLQVRVEPSWQCHTFRISSFKKLSIRTFCWSIICFWTSNGSVRILKKAGGNIILLVDNCFDPIVLGLQIWVTYMIDVGRRLTQICNQPYFARCTIYVCIIIMSPSS